MKERNRIFAVLLAIMMVFTYMPGLTYAAAGDESDPAVTVESQEGSVTEDVVQDEPAEATEPAEASETETQTEAPAAQVEEAEPTEADASTEFTENEEEVEDQATVSKVHHGMVKGLADSDELLESFMDKQIEVAHAGLRAKAAGNNRRSTLTEDEQAAYDELQEQIAAVVSGQDDDYDNQMSIEGNIDFDSVDNVITALMLDMPYEFFWYDKTEGYTAWTSDEGDMILVFSVSKAYRDAEPVKVEELDDGEGGVIDIPVYRIINTAAPAAAAESAKAIALDICDEYDTDFDKLNAFKDAVCNLTDYNDDAIAEDYTDGYGDPWQMIYVFDEDSTTNVVCEGYSKAFQYLCDYAQNQGLFESSETDCHTVTGDMEGGTGAGLHMWNILHMDDGKNYIADITNCDYGSIGYSDELFLKGYSSGDVDEGYTYYCNGEDPVSYVYDEDTRNQYSDDELVMSANDYGEGGGQEEEYEITYTTSHVFYEKLNGYTLDNEYYVYNIDAYDGDVLTINGESYIYSYGRDAFISEDGEDEISRNEVEFGDGNQDETHWILDGGKDTEVSYNVYYEGNETTVTAVLSPKPELELSYTRGGTLTEIVDGSWVLNEDGENDWFYYWENAIAGDVLTVNGTKYTYKEKRTYYEAYYYSSDWGFFNYDMSEKLDASYFRIQAVPYQSESHWILSDDEESKDFPIVVTYIDNSVDSYTTVIKNPIESISYKRNKEFIENKNGYDWIDGDEESFFYYWINPEYGDVLTVNGVEYVYKDHYDEDGGWAGFYNGDERIDGVSFDSNQISEHWVIPVGEEETTVTFTVSYLGHTTDVEAKLIINPITGISYDPVDEYADLIEGVDGWQEDDNFFMYDLPYFSEGDRLTVHYRNKDDSIYEFKEEDGDFVNIDDKNDRIYTWVIDRKADQDEQWTLTEDDEYYAMFVTYEGFETLAKKIRIVPNPINSISFSRDGKSEIELIEGKDSDTAGYWDEESEEEEIEYTYYNLYFEIGDHITVNRTDGTSAEYEYRKVKTDQYSDWLFVNIDDETEVLDDDYLRFYEDPEQSPANEWQVGNVYKAVVKYFGKTTDVNVKIIANPVSNIEFESADGSKTVKRVEGVDGEMDWDWDEDYNEEYYFRYYFPEFNAGDKLTVTKNDLLYTYVYKTRVFDGEFYQSAFVNYDSDGNIIDAIFDDDDIEIWDSNQSYDSPWELGGEGYYFEYKYYGKLFRIPAEVVANPVSAIDFERDGYDENNPIVLTEGIDAEINSDGGENRWFEYYLTFKNGDKFKLTDTDGNVSVYNTETYSEDDTDVRYFRNDEGEMIDPYDIDQTSDQSYDNQWVPDDGKHTITLGYYARTKDVNVVIRKNPVQEISFVRPGSDVIELTEDGEGYWGDYSFNYEIRFRDGDELYVTYEDENDPVKYVASAASNGWVYEFNAEGTVPSGAEETISAYDISFRHNKNWQLQTYDDEQATIMLMYQGMWTDVPVNIVENNVESFEFVWAEGTERVELVEGKDGYEAKYYEDDGDVTAFEYWMPFADGDALKVKYAGAEDPVTYVYSTEVYAFVAEGSVPDGAPAMIADDDIDQRSDQSYDIHWEVEENHEVVLDYMGKRFTVPVTIVKDTNSYDINDCSVWFDEEYLVNEDIATTEYPDWFFAVPVGTTLEPIVKDGDEVLTSDCYTAKYLEQEFDVTADGGNGAWGPKDGAEWLDEFPTETGVYFCQVSGAGQYTGTYEGMLPLIRIGDHSFSEWTVTKEATCTTEGERARTCSHCKVRYTEVLSVDTDAHAWGEPAYVWESDNSKVTATRFCGINPNHSETETVDTVHTVIKGATEAEDGEEQWTATFTNKAFDSQTKTEVIPAAGHTHSMTHTAAVAATCTEAGNTEYWYCSGCKKYFSDESGTNEITDGSWVIKAFGHNYGEWQTYDDDQHQRVCANDSSHVEYADHIWDDGEVTKPATCVAEGVTTYTCTVCGEIKTEKISATGKHTEEVIPGVAATCTETGLSEGKKCSVCGTVLVAQEVIPALGHKWGKATYSWNEDYTEVTGTHSCSVCGVSETATAKRASAETIKAPTVSEKGKIVYTSEAFAEEGFEVQTVTVEIDPLTLDEAIEQAENQTDDADEKATGIENSTDEAAISDAEDAAAKAAEYAAMAAEAAEAAFESAQNALDNLPEDASDEVKAAAQANLENAAANVAVAKQLVAAANSAVARSKKAAASVAASKAAAAYSAANSAGSSTAAEAYRKEAAAQAAIAAEKAGAADSASEAAAQAVKDLEALEDEMAGSQVAEDITNAKTKADTSAGKASEAAAAADTSSNNAKASANGAQTAVNTKAKAEADARAEAARQGTYIAGLPKVKISKPAAAKKSITVKWKKLSKKELKKGVTNIEVWVCPNAAFGKDTIIKFAGKKKASLKVKGLAKGTYWVKVRAIKNVGGVKYYTAWSKVKKIKVKK